MADGVMDVGNSRGYGGPGKKVGDSVASQTVFGREVITLLSPPVSA